MIRGTLFALLIALVPAGAMAQTRAETLADIRQELSVVFVEIQKLKRELSTTQGAGGVQMAGSVLDRVNAIEAQLQALTSRTEDLQNRVDRVVADGTNRIGDLEFRLCEMEAGCNVSNLDAATTLGGGDMPATSGGGVIQPANDGNQSSAGPAMAVAEQADFDRAKAALDSGSFQRAADLFETFAQTYPGGPLTGSAHYWRGEALSEQGETALAARAYLESFSGDPQGPVAADALYALGVSLADLGQTNEACVTLGEVQTRFPDSNIAFDAGAERRTIGCN